MKFFRIVKECISLNEWHKKKQLVYKKKGQKKQEELNNDIRIYLLEV